jgi:hypothetical protein
MPHKTYALSEASKRVWYKKKSSLDPAGIKLKTLNMEARALPLDHQTTNKFCKLFDD